MKIIKKLSATLAVAALVLTCLTACHKKGEIAVKVGDQSFTSGYYACALVLADTEARSKVDEALSAKNKSTENVDYMKQKVEGKTYEKWVKDKALDTIKLNAAYKIKCAEKGYKLDDDLIATAESYVEYYWESYGYKEIFSENGVSKETFTEYTKDSYYAEVYFDKTYGKDGEKAISDEEIKTALSEHYVLVDELSATLSGEDEEADKELRAKYEGYKNQLTKNPAKFAEIYDIENPPTEETATEDAATDSTEDESPKPIDSKALILGDEKSGMQSGDFDTVKAMAVGEVKLLDADNELKLIVKLDILADPYYATQYDENVRSLIVGDGADNDMRDFAKTLKTTTVKSAINLFKVKKIKYPK